MDFFFPEDNLLRMTPEETHITSLTAEPYPDGYRLRVNIEITPFQKRPYIEVTLNDADGEEVASSSIVEPLTWKLEFTMHIRGELKNPYTVEAKLFYPDGPAAEPQTFSFDVKPPQSNSLNTTLAPDAHLPRTQVPGSADEDTTGTK
ncbi:MAG: hypothetical protein L0287_15850 [Anaerolineae bacterium]|nr:hypothetical protein [Anaerolineae bacterium]MCI0608488.1 hypothetical protein [Anaerolineae bacterium]